MFQIKEKGSKIVLIELPYFLFICQQKLYLFSYRFTEIKKFT